MDIQAIAIIVGIFGTFYFTLAFTQSDGAWGSLARFRGITKVQNFGLLECFICSALWVATIFSIVIALLFFHWYDMFWLAIIFAGAAVLLDRLSTR